ncbi:hypothetical protein FKM82_018038 [Ascaphus truei]
MDSVRMWLLKKVDFLKHMILGSPDVEPTPLPPWSLESPFQTWNIYSKASLAASMLCFIGFLVLFSRKKPIGHSKSLVKRKTAPRLNVRTVHNRPTLDTWLEAFALLMVLCLFVTIPWEWVRLYQIEVAKKTTVLSEGYSNSCYREDHSFWEAVKVWLSWNFSWDKDSCEKYYKALIVDPVWEVTPLMVISSAIGRMVIHPVEQMGHMTGRSLRNIMKEIPSQWQPLVMLFMPLISVTLLAAAYFRSKHTTLVVCQGKEVPTRPRNVKGAVQLRA